MRRWAKVVARVLVVVVAVPLVFAGTMYASAWYYRWRAGQLLAVLKAMTPGVTTEAEYTKAVKPLQGSSLHFGWLEPGGFRIANYPKWLIGVCSFDRPEPCNFIVRMMPDGALFAVDPKFADGKLAYLVLGEGQGPYHSYSATTTIYARRYEKDNSSLPETFPGYFVGYWGDRVPPWETFVKLDERATPAERQSAMDFQFQCFTRYRMCRDADMFLKPAPNRPGFDGSR